MGNTFGNLFRITTYGESHGVGVGVVIDGCPSGVNVFTEEIQYELNRRRPGQSKLTTARKESDLVKIQSGIYENTTLGTPISLYIKNSDAKSEAYNNLKKLYRPSHADYTYEQKFGFRDWRGGGRASNRESVGRVASGAIAKKILNELCGIQTQAWVDQVYHIRSNVDFEKISAESIEANEVRCPDPEAAILMRVAILKAKNSGDSLGGNIRFRVTNCPPGIGNPVFGKLTAELAKGLMSIPATRHVSFGEGKNAFQMSGFEHNDQIILNEQDQIRTETNHAGGIVGGITNGEPILGEVSFKPTATIFKEQKTVTTSHEPIKFMAKGRHDPCVLPRAVPIVEAMINLVLIDHILVYTISNIERLKKIFY